MGFGEIIEIIQTEINTIVVVPIVIAQFFNSIPYFSFFMGLTLVLAVVIFVIKTGIISIGGGGQIGF